ncbi:MAG TPA: hypothetical protein PLL78_03490 [Fimbriimonadaceae bacterium]|nr:hypothetical protein [Fimbriimonadaceae bacterium]HRJ95724.1 hypothetical protein [Fimbriimonadaceae bacterium]
MRIERIDYAARARDRLESALRKVGPDPPEPNSAQQRRAIAQQAFLMARQAVEKRQSQPAADNRPAPASTERDREEHRADRERKESQRSGWRNRRGAGLDIVV